MQDVTLRFPDIYRATVPPSCQLSDDDIRAIMKVAYLAIEIDLDEDPAEMTALEEINRILLDPARAAELVAMTAALVTPGVDAVRV